MTSIYYISKIRGFKKCTPQLMFIPKAVCKTMVPNSCKVLLSQRRRWINSTIHNLLELIMIPQLCGIFCFSMQFVILLELLGTVILPAAFLFFVYLALALAFGADVLIPLLFMAGMLLLQAILILLTSRRLEYIFWMIIFVLAMPIWNLVLPLYAFWHFDDFSWGKTRPVEAGGENKQELYHIEEDWFVPTKRWKQWELQQHHQHQHQVDAISSN